MRIKIIALFCAAVMFVGICASARYSSDDLPDRLNDAVKWSEEYFDPSLNPQFEGSSYQIMALARMGRDYDYSSYLRNIEDYTAGYTEYTPASSYALASLAISSAGGDPRNADGRDLLADGIYNRAESSPLLGGSINDISLSLIALDSKNYNIPEGASVTREDMISTLIGLQQPDGSFGNAYSTALALSALSGYVGENVSAEAINSAVDYLSSAQNADGGYDDLETTAAVLMALDTVGVNSDNDMRFVKNNNNVTDALLNYGAPDGSFYAYGDGTGEATGIAACAMTSHLRYLDSNSDFFSFDMPDMPQSMEEFNRPENNDTNNGAANNTSGGNTSSGSSNNTPANSGSNNSSSSGSSSNNNGVSTAAPNNNSSNDDNSSNGSNSGSSSGSSSSGSNSNSSSSSGSSSNSSGSNNSQPARTSRPSSSSSGTTPRPAATIMPRVTVAPRATVAPRPSNAPGTSTTRPARTPKPTEKPELVGPVRVPGPMPAPTSTPEADAELAGALERDGKGVPVAVGIIALFALGAIALAFLANRKKPIGRIKTKKEKTKSKPNNLVNGSADTLKQNEKDKAYHAKIHRRTEIHGAYKTREKYKKRGKYKGSYRK